MCPTCGRGRAARGSEETCSELQRQLATRSFSDHSSADGRARARQLWEEDRAVLASYGYGEHRVPRTIEIASVSRPGPCTSDGGDGGHGVRPPVRWADARHGASRLAFESDAVHRPGSDTNRALEEPERAKNLRLAVLGSPHAPAVPRSDGWVHSGSSSSTSSSSSHATTCGSRSSSSTPSRSCSVIFHLTLRVDIGTTAIRRLVHRVAGRYAESRLAGR